MQDPRTAPTKKMPAVTPKEDPRTAPTKILPAVKQSLVRRIVKKARGLCL